MPKRVSKEAKRVPLNCLILPETLARLKAVKESYGVAVDKAVAAWLEFSEAQSRIALLPSNTQPGDVLIGTVKPLGNTNLKKFKGPTPKPKDRK